MSEVSSQKVGHTRLHLFQYSLMALPLAFAGLPVYLHAPDFYTTQMGISLASIGLVLLGLRVFDAVQDPLIGMLSDRFYQSRRSILLVGMVLLAGGFWMIFNPVGRTPGTMTDPLIWFSIAILLCTTGFSVVSINFQTLGGLWRSSVFERTRITGWREAFGLIGLLLAAIAPTILGSNTDPVSAFSLLGFIYLPLLAIAGVVLFSWLKSAQIEKPEAQQSQDVATVARGWRTLNNCWNRQFFGIYLLNNVASAIPAVLVIFFIRDRLEAEVYTGGFLLLYFLSGAISMPIWHKLSQKMGQTGKFEAWAVSMMLAVVTFVWAFTLGQGDMIPFAIVCALSGLALGADLSLPPSIIADRIADEQSQDIATRYFSVMTFLSKLALALATGAVLPALGALGYQPGAVSDYAVTGYLSGAYALVPCVLKFFVALWLYLWFRRASHLSQ